MSWADALLDRIPEPSAILRAVVTSPDPLTVDNGAGEVSAIDWIPAHRHATGDRVLVLMSKGTAHVIGSQAVRPQIATVATVNDSTATVTVTADAATFTVPYLGSAPTVGAKVALAWGADGGVLLGTLSNPAPPPPPATDAPIDPDQGQRPPENTEGSITAPASIVVTARRGSWRSDGAAARRAYQGRFSGGISDDNVGYAFYGGSLVREGATATEARIEIHRDTGAGMSAAREIRIRAHSSPDRPTNPPPLLTAGEVIGSIPRGGSATLPLPLPIAQGLLDGTYGGIALDHPGTTHYLAALGPDDRSSAFQISINYTLGG